MNEKNSQITNLPGKQSQATKIANAGAPMKTPLPSTRDNSEKVVISSKLLLSVLIQAASRASSCSHYVTFVVLSHLYAILFAEFCIAMTLVLHSRVMLSQQPGIASVK